MRIARDVMTIAAAAALVLTAIAAGSYLLGIGW